MTVADESPGSAGLAAEGANIATALGAGVDAGVSVVVVGEGREGIDVGADSDRDAAVSRSVAFCICGPASTAAWSAARTDSEGAPVLSTGAADGVSLANCLRQYWRCE